MSNYNSKKMIEIKNKTNILLADMPEFYKRYVKARSTRLAPSTLLAYTYKFNIFLDFLRSDNSYFGNKNKKDITLDDLTLLQHEDILDFMDWLQNHIMSYTKGKYDPKNANNTVSNYLACLSSIWNYFKRLKELDYNPVESIERAKLVTKPIIALTHEEKDKLINGINSGQGLRGLELVYHDKNKLRDETIFRLLLDTGMRVSEMVGIDISHLNFNKHFVTVTRKGGDIDKVYFSDSVEEYLMAYLEIRNSYKPSDDENALFLNRFGQRMGVRGVEKLVKKYTDAILIERTEKISVHKLRSTSAIFTLERTGNIELVRSRLGQKSLNVVLRYANASEKTLEENRNILSESDKKNK